MIYKILHIKTNTKQTKQQSYYYRPTLYIHLVASELQWLASGIASPSTLILIL